MDFRPTTLQKIHFKHQPSAHHAIHVLYMVVESTTWVSVIYPVLYGSRIDYMARGALGVKGVFYVHDDIITIEGGLLDLWFNADVGGG